MMEAKKEGGFVVGQKFQTHPWSHLEGGYVVTVRKNSSRRETKYERVKNANRYIKAILEKDETVNLIKIQGQPVWSSEAGYLVVINDAYPPIETH